MINLSKLLLVLFTAVLSTGTAQAQSSSDKPTPRTFRLISIVGEYGELRYQPTPRETVKVTISKTLSGDYLAPKSDELVLYREVPPPPDSPPNTPPIKEVAVSVPFPLDVERAIILLAPIDQGKFAAKFLVDDPAEHPVNTLRVFNFSTKPIAAMFGKTQLMLPAGQEKLISYPKGPTLIDIKVQSGQRWNNGYRAERIARNGLHAYAIITNYIPDPTGDPYTVPPPILFRLLTETVPEVSQ